MFDHRTHQDEEEKHLTGTLVSVFLTGSFCTGTKVGVKQCKMVENERIQYTMTLEESSNLQFPVFMPHKERKEDEGQPCASSMQHLSTLMSYNRFKD